MDASQINRLLSLPASVLLFLFSIKEIIFFVYLQKIDVHDVVVVVGSFFFLLTSILLLLDFFCERNIFVKRKVWLFFFCFGFVVNIIF